MQLSALKLMNLNPQSSNNPAGITLTFEAIFKTALFASLSNTGRFPPRKEIVTQTVGFIIDSRKSSATIE